MMNSSARKALLGAAIYGLDRRLDPADCPGWIVVNV